MLFEEMKFVYVGDDMLMDVELFLNIDRMVCVKLFKLELLKCVYWVGEIMFWVVVVIRVGVVEGVDFIVLLGIKDRCFVVGFCNILL